MNEPILDDLLDELTDKNYTVSISTPHGRSLVGGRMTFADAHALSAKMHELRRNLDNFYFVSPWNNCDIMLDRIGTKFTTDYFLHTKYGLCYTYDQRVTR